MRQMAPPGQENRPESGDWPDPPIGGTGQSRDVAAAAVFYASDEADFITGTTLLVDGGMTAANVGPRGGAASAGVPPWLLTGTPRRDAGYRASAHRRSPPGRLVRRRGSSR
jgi:hypothetical protein